MALVYMDERVYTTSEVAEIIRVHPKTVRKMIRRGQLDAFKVLDEYRITQSALDELMRRQPKKAEDQPS